MWMQLSLLGVAILAGVVNALAGGGLLFTFPALVAWGVPPLVANATANVASWPGYLSAGVAMRRELRHAGGLRGLLVAGLAGGISGAALLKVTSPQVFLLVVPWLLLAATLMFWFSRTLLAWLKRDADQLNRPLLLGGAYVVSVYGGFFGGGMGVMMMTLFSLAGIAALPRQNALKIFLSLVLNTASVAVLLFSDLVRWDVLAVMAVGYTAGGYLGGRVMAYLPIQVLRGCVVVMGLVMSAVFFGRAYG